MTSRPRRWRNWSRLEQSRPRQVCHPRSVAELVECVRSAAHRGQRVRAVGAGHSFTGAAVAEDCQVRLDRLDHLIDLDQRTGRVTVESGVTLGRLSRLLAVHGLAMENLGDVDRQTISGAIATGTHGTGAALPGLAAQVRALEVVRADGSVVECSGSGQAGLFEAARLSVGAVGVVATVTLQCVPAFTLRAVERPMPLAEVEESLEAFVDGHDHFEFYWFPHTDRTLTKTNDRVPVADQPLPRWRYVLDDEVLSNGVFAAVNRWCALAPGTTPVVNQLSARALGAREYTGPSHQVFCSPRRVRFAETEYAVPAGRVRDVLRALRSWVDSHDARIPFPVEVRFAAADDVWLSTAYQRPSAYVAVHQNLRMRREPYFTAFEQIAREAGGRPHWGKLHSLGREDLAPLYPRFDDFLAQRDSADPDRVFANPYTERVFGP